MPIIIDDTTLTQGQTTVALKVDVDTKVGFIQGVRNLADLMNELRVKASFYLSMGPDNSGRALKRLFKPGFLRKQMRSGAASAYGPITMLYGVLLPGPIIAEKAPGLLNRLVNEGHEVGIHAWDHVLWHDRMRKMSKDQVADELKKAFALFERISGFAPSSFASPGWQITDDAFEVLYDFGVRHCSTTRGTHAFFPESKKGKALPMLEIPTTLPTLDEVMGKNGMNKYNAGRRMAAKVKMGRLNVFTLHGEVEGRGQAPIFKEFCQRLQDKGVKFVRLIDAAHMILDTQKPVKEKYVYASLPGRAGDMALQESLALDEK